jgi:hypothetical protein
MTHMTCGVPQCPHRRHLYKFFCEEHACIVCPHQRLVGAKCCIHHKCRTSSCNEYVGMPTYALQYCSKHRCVICHKREITKYHTICDDCYHCGNMKINNLWCWLVKRKAVTPELQKCMEMSNLCLGHHPRCGQGTPLVQLPIYTLQHIASFL